MSRHATRPLNYEEEITVLKLMELQRHAMLMYTSCGWFFDELSGIETVQVIQYAGRVLQLADQLFSGSFEPTFLEHLELAKSNIPEHSDGRAIYEAFVRPAMLDMKNVGAHYAVSSLFQEIGERSSIYSYSAIRRITAVFRWRSTKLVIGRATVTSEVTPRYPQACALEFYILVITISPAARVNIRERKDMEHLSKRFPEAFARADFPKAILLLGKHFGTSMFSLTSLFADERRKVLNMIMEPTLREAEASYGSLYEHHAPLIRFLKGAGAPLPKGLALAAELCLNAKLRGSLQGEGLDPKWFDLFWKKLVWPARLWMRLLWDCYWQSTSSIWPNSFSNNLTTFLAWRG